MQNNGLQTEQSLFHLKLDLYQLIHFKKESIVDETSSRFMMCRLFYESNFFGVYRRKKRYTCKYQLILSLINLVYTKESLVKILLYSSPLAYDYRILGLKTVTSVLSKFLLKHYTNPH